MLTQVFSALARFEFDWALKLSLPRQLHRPLCAVVACRWTDRLFSYSRHKFFYGDSWRHRPHPCPRKVNTYAYSKGRRRKAAILIQHMVRWRLTRGDVLAPIGTTKTGFDASNAFMSVHHTTLEKLVETSFEDERDRALMKQRYRGAQISLRAEADEPRVEIVPSLRFFTRRRHWPFSF